MRIVGVYSFKQGHEVIQAQYPWVLDEVRTVLSAVDSAKHLTKVSTEKTMPGKMLYSPTGLNGAIKAAFDSRGWQSHRERCEYSDAYYVDGYTPDSDFGGRPYREMDFVKNRVGVEVQFGKYAFMVYNVLAKMTIFHNLNVIDVGVEIVPVRAFTQRISTGVSYFEQIVWDLDQRGTSDIDILVLVLGITSAHSTES